MLIKHVFGNVPFLSKEELATSLSSITPLTLFAWRLCSKYRLLKASYLPTPRYPAIS